MRHSLTKNSARGWHHGGALETVQPSSLNNYDDTTDQAWLQVSRLVSGFALLPDTAAALVCLAFGGG